MVNKKIINNDDFSMNNDACYLSSSGRQKFIYYYNEKLNSTVKSGNSYVSYNTIIQNESYKLLKSIKNDEKYISYRAR